MADRPATAGHDEIAMMLPWYVNGTLGAGERDAVAAHLDVCAACREALADCVAMHAAVAADGATPIPPAVSAGDLLDGSARRTRRVRARWRIAAGIAALAIAAGTLVAIPLPWSGSTFEAVTGAASATTVDYVFEVRLVDGLTGQQQADALAGIGGRDAALLSGDSAYRVTIAMPPRSLAELEAMAAEFERRDDVLEARLVALQVPAQ